MMTSRTTRARFKRGDRVKLLTSPGLCGTVESFGKRIVDGPQFYRVKLRCPASKPKFVQVREDQLELEAGPQDKKVLPRALRDEEITEVEFDRITAAASPDASSRGVLRRRVSPMPTVE